MVKDVGQLYTTYGPMVLRRCRFLLKDEEAARDALQDVFIQVLRHQERLEDRGLSSLLYTMATRVCLNRLRSRRRSPESREEFVLDSLAGWDDPEAGVDARETVEAVFALEEPDTRTMAVLHYVDGLTLEETAHTVGLSVSGLRKRLRRLKARAAAWEAGS